VDHIATGLVVVGDLIGSGEAQERGIVGETSKGQKNDFRNAEAIAEAEQRPTMKFVATKTAILASRASTWPRDHF
jgi:hypothetical protein